MMRSTRTTPWILALLGIVLTHAPAWALDEARLNSLWDDLGAADDATNARALLALASTPNPTLAYLDKHLEPVKADRQRIAALIKQLDDESRARRQEAADSLAWLGDFARPALEKALDDAPSDRARSRITELLETLPATTRNDPFRNGLQGNNVSVQSTNGQVQIMIDGKRLDLGKPLAEDPQRRDPWRRAVRAIALLESIGNAQARSILERLATGEPDAAPTREARIALKNLDQAK